MPTEDCWKDLGALHARVGVLEEGLDEANKKLDAILNDRSFAHGAVWALAKVGAGVVIVLSGIGWISTNGFPIWIKNLFR